MGRFSTEIELKLHGTIIYCFRHAKLIGPDDDINSLQNYSYEICARYTKEKLRYFPNAMKTLDTFIVVSGDIFDSFIIEDEIHISEMPPVQLSLLYASVEEDAVKFSNKMKINLIDASFLELRIMKEVCSIPSKEERMNTRIGFDIEWDTVEFFYGYVTKL